jgi:Spy/CpxP family protein refolding chaperone
MTSRVPGWLLAGIFVATAATATAWARPMAPAFELDRGGQDGGRRHKWWQDERFRAELALTPQQAEEVEQIFQSSVPRLRQLKDQLDDLEKNLSKMIKERAADDATIATAVDRVEGTRSELNKARTLMLYRMHRVLTADQNDRLRAMLDRGHRDRDKDKKENRDR